MQKVDIALKKVIKKKLVTARKSLDLLSQLENQLERSGGSKNIEKLKGVKVERQRLENEIQLRENELKRYANIENSNTRKRNVLRYEKL